MSREDCVLIRTHRQRTKTLPHHGNSNRSTAHNVLGSSVCLSVCVLIRTHRQRTKTLPHHGNSNRSTAHNVLGSSVCLCVF